MRSWQTETGSLACNWSEIGQYVPYNPDWMQAVSDVPSGYLPPVPDFASRNPFGGTTSWFELHSARRDPR